MVSNPLYIEPLPKQLRLDPKIGIWNGYLNPVPYIQVEKNSAWQIIVYNTIVIDGIPPADPFDYSANKPQYWRLLVIRGQAVDRPEIPGIEGSECSVCASPIPAGLSFENAEEGGWLFDLSGMTGEPESNPLHPLRQIMRLVFDSSSEIPIGSEILEKIQRIIEMGIKDETRTLPSH